jgi:hypothetical protein
VSADLLGTIVAATRRIVDVRAQVEPLPALRARVSQLGSAASTGRFHEALARPDRVNVIAEC